MHRDCETPLALVQHRDAPKTKMTWCQKQKHGAKSKAQRRSDAARRRAAPRRRRRRAAPRRSEDAPRRRRRAARRQLAPRRRRATATRRAPAPRRSHARRRRRGPATRTCTMLFAPSSCFSHPAFHCGLSERIIHVRKSKSIEAKSPKPNMSKSHQGRYLKIESNPDLFFEASWSRRMKMQNGRLGAILTRFWIGAFVFGLWALKWRSSASRWRHSDGRRTGGLARCNGRSRGDF
ncbi:hypothetical protein M885DRAFT_503466 [Pelagophyceae sp. CCMP2097]|nr:hypothetical protein M885DRAFT_503466 [Pelagophyceae sp. CCMP2097]